MRAAWAAKGNMLLAQAAKREIDRVTAPAAEGLGPGAAPKISLAGTRWKFPDRGTVTFTADTWLASGWTDRMPRKYRQIGPQTFAADGSQGDRILTVTADMGHMLIVSPDGKVATYFAARVR